MNQIMGFSPKTYRIRARVYVACVMVRNLIFGLALIFFDGRFVGPAYDSIFSILPSWTWGIVALVSASLIATTFILKNDKSLWRFGFYLSSLMLMLWTLGMFASGILSRSPTTPLIWLSVTFADMLIATLIEPRTAEKMLEQNNIFLAMLKNESERQNGGG